MKYIKVLLRCRGIVQNEKSQCTVHRGPKFEEPTQTCIETCIAQCCPEFQKQLCMDMHSIHIVYLSLAGHGVKHAGTNRQE